MSITYELKKRKKCTECGRIMLPGTNCLQVQKPKENGFKLEYRHADGCPVMLFEI